VGFSDKSKAALAPELPRFLALSSLNFLDETKDSSDMAKIPLRSTKPIIINSSIRI
jgi:hypothetical protein